MAFSNTLLRWKYITIYWRTLWLQTYEKLGRDIEIAVHQYLWYWLSKSLCLTKYGETHLNLFCLIHSDNLQFTINYVMKPMSNKCLKDSFIE